MQRYREVLLFLATVLLTVSHVSADPLSYQFDINASSIAGTTGFLDIQFNPGPSADAAQASVFGFNADYASQSTPGDSVKPGPSLVPAKEKHLASSSQIKSKAATSESLVVITSPSPGQVFHVGDTITINILVDPSFPVASVLVDSNAFTQLNQLADSKTDPSIQATQINSMTFQATLTLPATFAGPLTLGAVAFDSQGNDLESAMLTLAVQPAIKPSSVFMINRYIPMNPATTSGTEQLGLIGNYPNNVQIDLTSAESGTTYVSSNPSVITVDSEGDCTIATTSDDTPATGIASVTATNSGLSDYAVFVVQNPQSPLPPLDVTSSAKITVSGFTLNRQTGFFVGEMTISATGNGAVPGPIYVLLNGLSNGVSLVNGNGISVNTNSGTPYISLTLPGQGLVFAPGQTLTVPIQLLNPNRVLVTFTPSLIRSSTAP